MNGGVLGGLVLVGLVLVALGMSGLYWRRDDQRLRLRRAHRWAKAVDLSLPPELVDPLAARLRRRTGAVLLFSTVMVVLALGLKGRLLVPELLYGTTSPVSLLQGPLLALVLMAPALLASAAAGLWELSRQRRADALSGNRPVQIGLRDVVPSWVMWSARVLTLAPPVIAAGLVWDLHQKGLAGSISPVMFGALLVFALMWLRAAENRQLAVLNGRQAPGSAQALAFDDAFRVQTVLDLVAVLPVLIFLGASALLQPVLSDAAHRNQGAALRARDLWLAPGLLVFVLGIVLTLPHVRRYYRGRSAPPLLPPTSETTPC
nr:hypothetical protein [Streptomyces sp. 846.5]